MTALDTVIVPINRAGWPFIAGFALVAAVLAHFSIFWGEVGLVLTCWCIYFFRDPPRTVPARAGLVVSPGDGRVSLITMAAPPPELGMGSEPRLRISIFLNVFNVHVNRVPIEGTIEAAQYHPGKFLSAALDKASDENERMAVRLRTAEGQDIAFVQIAGLVARRIICTLIAGQKVRTGERFGLIRFGSRVDVYLPESAAPLVVVGQTAIGGETVLADLAGQEPARTGEVR